MASSLHFDGRMSEMHEWPLSERPRERLLSQGAHGITDAELLALVLGSSTRGSGGVIETSRKLLHRHGGLAGLARSGAGELMQTPGIGTARACAVLALVELARRFEGQCLRRGEPIESAAEAYQRLRQHLALRHEEVFAVLVLDARHRLLSMRQVAQGSATSVDVHPREVFGPAVREGATSLIVAHNHPAGQPEPSHADLDLTRRLKEAGGLLGIALLDHLIVGDGCFVSLAERGLL